MCFFEILNNTIESQTVRTERSYSLCPGSVELVRLLLPAVGGAEQGIFPSREADTPPQSVTHVRHPGKLLLKKWFYSFKTLFRHCIISQMTTLGPEKQMTFPW